MYVPVYAYAHQPHLESFSFIYGLLQASSRTVLLIKPRSFVQLVEFSMDTQFVSISAAQLNTWCHHVNISFTGNDPESFSPTVLPRNLYNVIPFFVSRQLFIAVFRIPGFSLLHRLCSIYRARNSVWPPYNTTYLLRVCIPLLILIDLYQ